MLFSSTKDSIAYINDFILERLSSTDKNPAFAVIRLYFRVCRESDSRKCNRIDGKILPFRVVFRRTISLLACSVLSAKSI